MSSHTGSSAREETAEERAARELREAQARFARLEGEVAALGRTMAAAAATYEGVAMSPPEVPQVESSDTAALTRAADDLTAALDRSRAELNLAVAEAEAHRLAQVASTFFSPPAQEATEQSGSDSGGVVEDVRHGRVEEVERILARLPGDSAADVAQELEAAVSRVMLSATEAQAGFALDALRTLVQREADLSRLRARNRERLRSLSERLDGLSGAEVDRARAAIAAAELDRQLPPELERTVASARASAQREADQRAVLAAIAGGLETLGYQVAGSFIADVRQEGSIAMLPGSDRHGVNVRMRDGRVMFNVVRFDEHGRRDPAADRHAEARFCAVTGRLSELALARGARLDLEALEDVTPGMLQVVRQAPRPATQDADEDADVLRERTSDGGTQR